MVLALLLSAQAPLVEMLTRDPRLFCEWVTVATNGDRYTERLKLMPDGQFVVRRSGPDVGAPQKFAGTYVYGRATRDLETRIGPGGPSLPMLKLFVPLSQAPRLHYDAAQIEQVRRRGGTVVPFRVLLFESRGPILHDLLTVVFAPKGQEARIRRALAAQRASSGH